MSRISKFSDKIWILINSVLFLAGLVFHRLTFSLCLIILIWITLIFYNAYKADEFQNPFEYKTSVSLRGISAIEIMLGHIGLATNNFILYPNRKAGVLFVGIFFMLSGYGLTYSFYNKNGYLNNFFRVHLIKLLFPAFIIWIINVLITSLLWQEDNIWKAINFFTFFHSTNWYIWEFLILYFVFWFCFKISRNMPLMLLTMISMMMILIAWKLQLSNPWYGSILCFPLGSFCYFKNQMKFKNKVFKRSFCFWGLFFILIASIGSFFYLENTFFANVIARNTASLSFCSILILVLEEYKIGNRFTEHLGNCSYEIFLIHPMVISLLRKKRLQSDYIFSCLVIIITLIFSDLLKCLKVKHKNYIINKTKARKEGK